MFERIREMMKPSEPEAAHDKPVPIPQRIDDMRREIASDTLRTLARLLKQAVPDTPIGSVAKDEYSRLTLRLILPIEDAKLAYIGHPDWKNDPSAEATRAALNLMFLSKAPFSEEREAAMETERRILDAARTWRTAKTTGVA